MRALELYSGVGGMHYALQAESGIEGDVIAAVDINTIANSVYKLNFPNVVLMNRNIQSLSVNEINDLNVDTILMSPPCQPFTRVGLQKDILDNRSSSLFHVLELIPHMKTLKYILLENVKGFEMSEMRKVVLQCIVKAGFNFRELILSPCQFGIPNTRYRYYLLAKRRDLDFCFNDNVVDFALPDEAAQIILYNRKTLPPERTEIQSLKTDKNCYKLENIVENIDGLQYLIPKKLLQKRANLLDIRTAESNSSCCFTKAYGRYIEGTGSVYCPFSENIMKNAFLKASKCKKQSLEALEVLEKLELRYFTPKEVCRLMCFPEKFTFPEHITCKQKYRLLGNSINIHVVSKLIYLLYSEKKIT